MVFGGVYMYLYLEGSLGMLVCVYVGCASGAASDQKQPAICRICRTLNPNP